MEFSKPFNLSKSLEKASVTARQLADEKGAFILDSPEKISKQMEKFGNNLEKIMTAQNNGLDSK